MAGDMETGDVEDRVNDVIVVGAGPAGLAAALYAARARMTVLVLERSFPGGLMGTTNEIENYPGFKVISGSELAARMLDQAEGQGARLRTAEVTGIGPTGADTAGAGKVDRVVETAAGPLRARAVIIASGSEPRRLGVPGEERLGGRGVSYCATCDGAFFQGEEVAVVGGGDSAFQEGIFLTRYARKVTIIHRADTFKAQSVLVERARRNERIEIVTNASVQEILGDDRVEGLRLRFADGAVRELRVGGVFPYIGLAPNTAFLPPEVARDATGRVVAGEDTRTSLTGVFAAGDVRTKMLRQITTAVADGAMAAMAVEHYLAGDTTLSY